MQMSVNQRKPHSRNTDRRGGGGGGYSHQYPASGNQQPRGNRNQSQTQSGDYGWSQFKPSSDNTVSSTECTAPMPQPTTYRAAQHRSQTDSSHGWSPKDENSPPQRASDENNTFVDEWTPQPLPSTQQSESLDWTPKPVENSPPKVKSHSNQENNTWTPQAPPIQNPNVFGDSGWAPKPLPPGDNFAPRSKQFSNFQDNGQRSSHRHNQQHHGRSRPYQQHHDNDSVRTTKYHSNPENNAHLATGNSKPDTRFNMNANSSHSSTTQQAINIKPFEEIALKENCFREAILVSCKDPNHFIVRLAELEKDFDKLTMLLGKESHVSAGPLQRGMAVCVVFKGKWRRGILHDVNERRIELIDLGRNTYAEEKGIKRLKPEYSFQPKYAIKCALTQDLPFTSQALANFREKFDNLNVLMKFTLYHRPSHRWLVKMFSLSELHSLERKIFSEKIVHEISEHMGLLNDGIVEAELLPMHTINSDTKDSENNVNEPRKENEEEQKEKYFYVKINFNDEEYKKLFSEMNLYYSKLPNRAWRLNKTDIDINKLAVINDNGNWRRVKITKIIENENIDKISDADSPQQFNDMMMQVFDLDQACFLDVSLDNVRGLLDSYAKIPPQAIKCCLAKENTSEINLDQTQSTQIKCQFMNKSETDDNCYCLKIFHNDTVINNKIQQSVNVIDNQDDENLHDILKSELTENQQATSEGWGDWSPPSLPAQPTDSLTDKSLNDNSRDCYTDSLNSYTSIDKNEMKSNFENNEESQPSVISTDIQNTSANESSTSVDLINLSSLSIESKNIENTEEKLNECNTEAEIDKNDENILLNKENDQMTSVLESNDNKSNENTKTENDNADKTLLHPVDETPLIDLSLKKKEVAEETLIPDLNGEDMSLTAAEIINDIVTTVSEQTSNVINEAKIKWTDELKLIDLFASNFVKTTLDDAYQSINK